MSTNTTAEAPTRVEQVGVEFIPENGGGVGVRLKARGA